MSDGFAGDGFLIEFGGVSDSGFVTMLIIENGSIVANADSYNDRLVVLTYATRYGFSFSSTEISEEQAILRAMIYIESFEDALHGARVSALQELSWPRALVPNKIGDAYLASNAIPIGVKNALSEAAIAELAAPGVLTATVSHKAAGVKRTRKKIGPLETEVEYVGGVMLDAKTYTRILEHLRPFLTTGRAAYSVRGH